MKNMRKIGMWIATLCLAGGLCFASGCTKVAPTAVFGEAEENGPKPEGSEEETEVEGAGDFVVAAKTEVVQGEGISENDSDSDEVQAFLEGEAEVALPSEPVLPPRPKVKGIYVTGPMAGNANMDNLIGLVERTELNAMVIDIKNDEGYIVYEMDNPTAAEIGAVKRYVKDMPALVAKCKEKGIYLIARIVAFRDPVLAQARPEWGLHTVDGTLFRDKDGLAWLSPYEEGAWEYLTEVALQAASVGFDEIQFDYVRFSTDRGMKQVDFGQKALEKSKEDAIVDFTAYACRRLHEAGVAVSADVYGVVIDSQTDQQIVGQNYLRMAEHLDYISPMVYPSHYGPGCYQIPIPDAQPYDTVLAAMQASKKVLAGIDPKAATLSGNATPEVLTGEQIALLPPLPGVRADVRPWLQDFTATWVKGHIKYGPQQLREQMQAVYDAGYEEWILWNAANRYTEGGLQAVEESEG